MSINGVHAVIFALRKPSAKTALQMLTGRRFIAPSTLSLSGPVRFHRRRIRIQHMPRNRQQQQNPIWAGEEVAQVLTLRADVYSDM